MPEETIRIDYEKCDGCGLCVEACHENALELVEENGRRTARLVRESECDRLGNCLPACPRGAIEKVPAADAAAAQCWPVQLKLVSQDAPFFRGAELLVAADCTAYSYPEFHAGFIKGRVVLIGCPKLDGADYSKKLERIFSAAAPCSVTLAKMEVPCCGGLLWMLKNAKERAGLKTPVRAVTISVAGEIIEEETL